jgi:hypothetical protein
MGRIKPDDSSSILPAGGDSNDSNDSNGEVIRATGRDIDFDISTRQILRTSG